MKRCAALAVALLVAAGGVLPARAAPAPTGPRRARFDLRAAQVFPRSRFPSGRKVLQTPPFSLALGERRIVRGRLVARSTTTVPMEQQLGLLCAEDGAPDTARAVLTSRNNGGRRVAGGLLGLDANYLLVAPRPGAYRCSLWARASSERIVALAYQTWLSISRADERVAQQWSGAPCASRGGRSDGTSTPASECRYLVPGGRGGFAATGAALTFDRFVADPAARAVEVLGDLQLTTCYRGTRSCVPEVSRFGGRSPHSRAVVSTRLDVRQLDVQGNVCGSAPRSAGAAARTTVIRARTHHQKIAHRLVMPVSDAPGCTRRFLVRVLARAVAGDPVKITEVVDDVQRRDGIFDGLPGVAMSNAIARSLF